MTLNPLHFTLSNTNSMSKEVMIGMLKVANNGNDLLQILDALTDTNEEVISSDAVDFSGQPINF